MMGTRAVALWCLLVVVAGTRAAAYTVDCNHEYTDCDTELSKITEEDEVLSQKTAAGAQVPTTAQPTRSPTTVTTDNITPKPVSALPPLPQFPDIEDKKENEEIKPKPRLLNLNVDELQNFAIALHNQSDSKGLKKHSITDLSDINLDDDEEPSRLENKPKDLPDQFFTNLQAPFNPLINVDRVGSDEIDVCKENEVTYKIGERIDRGCEETCECLSGGQLECSPRCKHPYIRRGRRLNDPLCFESPVDECCSIVACATGTGDMKVSKLDVCRYGNESHPVGSKWYVGCEQSCTCEPNSVVTCKPRCNPLPVSDKCINVQDPSDACCEVQVCDVSHDVHEEPENSTTSTTSTTETIKVFQEYDDRVPGHLELAPDPIGSVKVLQNNSVQVNLMHMNKSEDPIHLLLSNDGGKSFNDVELKYSNLILNLEGGKDYILKTKETGTKFNFTITASDTGNEVPNEDYNITKVGCFQDGNFYGVGEEFHIGCTELCECTGPDTRECAALVCPSHVGLELVSKGCVRWAPSPPALPPNCCPRSARCLSDGTCHYKGEAVPNWSEVPITLTGCEERCFCENGELDCQEVCSPLPLVPPQSLRCPPNHRPGAVNISDEDCCKQWGCIPNADNETSAKPFIMPVYGEVNYVTPIPKNLPTLVPILPTPPTMTTVDFFRHLSPVKSFPKFVKTVVPPQINEPASIHGDNITVFTLDDMDSPFKTILAEPPLIRSEDDWGQYHKTEKPQLSDPFRTSIHKAHHLHPETQTKVISVHKNMPDYILSQSKPLASLSPKITTVKHRHEPVNKIPISKLGQLNYFSPSFERNSIPEALYNKYNVGTSSPKLPPKLLKNMFEPAMHRSTIADSATPKISRPKPVSPPKPSLRKHVTILKTTDLKPSKATEFYHGALWDEERKRHVLTKEPNPYETVLLRAVPNAKVDLETAYQNSRQPQVAGKTYTEMDIENLLNQMELESVVNKNLGRSAKAKGQDDVAGQAAADLPPPPPRQPFLPTIPPKIHYPDEDDIDRPINGVEPGLPFPPGPFGDNNKKLSVLSLLADSPTSVKMLFGLPGVLVGLRGSVDLRYTDKADEDIAQWYSQVFAPADEVLTTPRLEFRLTGLKPSTTYKIRGKLYLHNLPVEPESEIYTIRTLDLPETSSTEEKRREIDSRLTVVDVNDTTAHVSWRHFNEDELQFIDGIQVRYRPVGTPIYSMTELLHHSRSVAELHDLRPNSRYEASLVLVPPPKATTELTDPGIVEFNTAPYADPYNWSVTIEVRQVGSEAAEVWWRGIPAPAERWVRVYRGAHACGIKREQDEFRLAARDLPPSITLTGLEPSTKCRVWLELFLTNGKVKTSNVLEINTKSADSAEPIDNSIESSSVSTQRSGDYYGALVGVGAVAALGALTSLLLLLVVLRRHRPRSVPITTVPSAPRESSLPPYDNPAYKLELQQETMDL